ncbi:MAG: PAS domain S-box protein [Deltaproteobacteria bacterium]|nr:PAS domain S-box protein [Deltaproteobacteria bacterium]
MQPTGIGVEMTAGFADFHRRNRARIIREWAQRLHTEVGDQYARRPMRELRETVSGAFDGNHQVLIHEDYTFMNAFIDKITRMRLEAGFLLSDVQKAFELYRTIVIPLLAREMTGEGLRESITRINQCLAYTIHRFSDHFQAMHEKEIREHNRRLEEQVRVRTVELRESELKYKTLVEEINEGYFVIQDEVIVFANQAYCQMHGYRPDEILGKRFHLFVDPGSREKVIEIYRNSIHDRSAPSVFEYMRLHKDGRSFPTEITAKVARYEQRDSNIGLCRDISKRVEMETRMREAERMAYVGQITTSLSHEIRNPLSAVKMNLQILEKSAPLRGNDRRRISISVKEVIRLERILTELLDFAKPIQMTFGPCQINEVLSFCGELLEMRFAQEGLVRIMSLDPRLPSIQGDGDKLGQAVINLLLNAMEASRPGATVAIRSLHWRDGGRPGVQVVIEDEGHGVPEDYLQDIFKPFFTTKSKGTGLGLAMVKRIVEAHGGSVDVENRESGGARFRLSLPEEKGHGQNSCGG